MRNPDEAERDQEKRADIVSETAKRIEELRQLKGEPHTKAACALRAPPTFGGSPVFGRYLKQNKTGALSLDRAKVERDARLDGKYLISTSEDSLPVEDVVLAYNRIRSHVLLCWLALLLIRVAENETDQTWRQLSSTLSKLKAGIHRTQSGEVWQSTPVTDEQKKVFAALQAELPPRYLSVAVAKGTGA